MNQKKIQEKINQFLEKEKLKNIDEIDVSFLNENCILININIISDLKKENEEEISLLIKDFFVLNEPKLETKIFFSKKKSNNKDSHEKNQNQKSRKIKKIIMIASGKGGVGKSTISSNLALQFSKLGWKTGLLDADIYGASIPLIFGLEDEMIKSDEKKEKMIPINFNENLKINSIAFITRSNEPLVWRGPMIVKALNQILNQTEWGELDLLIIDTPPGTGDIHISLLEKNLIDATCLISTKNKTSLANTQKTYAMIKKFKDQKKIFSILNMINGDLEENDDFFAQDFVKNSELIFKIPRIENFDDISFFDKHDESFNLIDEISRKLIKDLFLSDK
jgi:Mrp family chromosome partitioning ATPase